MRLTLHAKPGRLSFLYGKTQRSILMKQNRVLDHKFAAAQQHSREAKRLPVDSHAAADDLSYAKNLS